MAMYIQPAQAENGGGAYLPGSNAVNINASTFLSNKAVSAACLPVLWCID
jgi:hypothetical protein